MIVEEAIKILESCEGRITEDIAVKTGFGLVLTISDLNELSRLKIVAQNNGRWYVLGRGQRILLAYEDIVTVLGLRQYTPPEVSR